MYVYMTSIANKTTSDTEDDDVLEVFWPSGISHVQQQLVIRAAHWSRLAYTIAVTTPEEVQNLPDFLDSNICKLERVDCPKTDAFCLVFEVVGENLLVISTRGTTTKEDVLCDLQLLQTELSPECLDAMVHKGFHSQYEDLKCSIHARVMKHLQNGGDLLCTGHSLGAAVSAIMALSYALLFPKHVSFVGLGTPRPGNVAFANLMNEYLSSTICVKNKRDPVCALLPSLWYARVGQEIRIGHDHFPLIPDPLCVCDHNISDYIKHLTSRTRIIIQSQIES